MSVLVTGGTGFVGSNVVRNLAKDGVEVVCFGRSAEDPDPLRDWYFDGVLGNIHLHEGDVLKKENIKSAIKRYDINKVVHTATITPTSERERGEAENILSVNIIGTSNVLDVARESNVNRIVYTSSGSVYRANSELEPIDEYDELDLNGLYPISKYSSEQICKYYNEQYGMNTVAARLGWVYGPMERPVSSRAGMSEVYNAMCAALDGQTITINDLNRYRDWTYSHDVARALRLLLECNELYEDVYNLTAGRSHSNHELLSTIENIVGEITIDSVDHLSEAAVPVNSRNRRGPLSIERLVQTTGFEPNYTLEEGLADYYQWLKDAKENDML